MPSTRFMLPFLSAITAFALAIAGLSGAVAADSTSAFMFQRVSPQASTIRAGLTGNGVTVTSYGKDVMNVLIKGNDAYGDPTISRLSNGRWAMTGWSGGKDARGGSYLMYHESACPAVVDANAKLLGPSSATGCKAGAGSAVAMSKTSQIFDVNGSNYVITMAAAIHLLRLTDATRGASELSSVCVLQTPVTALDNLKWGEASQIISSSQASGLLLSDTAIARRADGTWVLFVKGIASDSGCAQGSLCELCARAIYRSTSTDLINWSALEKVASKASVPDATTYPDGKVWLYHQDFSPTCAAQDLKLAERAPIVGMVEGTGNVLSAEVALTFPGEDFETDTTLHYPTNGNPVSLPSAAAKAALDACMTSAFSKLTVSNGGTGGGTVGSVPGGISCGSACSQDFVTGNSLTLSATAATGSSFTSWGGACAGTATTSSCTVAMDAAKSVSAVFTSTLTVPGAPTIASVTPGPGQASVSFTAPASTGGASITGYTATCAATGLSSVSASNTRSPIGMSGLVVGVPYYCSVTATNSVGTGSASSSMAVTPTGTILVPICSLTATPAALASGSSSTLAVTCSPAATSYVWTGGGLASDASGGGVTPFFSTAYAVQGKNAAGSGNTASATVTVTDTMAYSGKRSDYAITGTTTSTGYSFAVQDKVGSGGTQTYATHKRLKFSDTNIGLDIDGVGGMAYRLYQAAFARVPDLSGLGFQMWAMDLKGWSLTDVAGGFIASPEFKTLYGASPTDTQYITLLYANVLKRAPDDGGLNFYLDGMKAGSPAFSRDRILTYFSESPENKALVLPAIKDGFEYTPTEGN